MNHAYRLLPLFALAATASAQGVSSPAPTVTSEGEAYVKVTPEYVDFWFSAYRQAETNVAAAEQANAFEQELNAQFAELGLKPQSVQASGVGIPNAITRRAQISVRARFGLVRFSEIAERVNAYAQLCDDVAKAREALECAVSAPVLGVKEPQEHEQQGVVRATENALYRADAVASSLQSQVYAVQHAEVLETTWLVGNELSEADAVEHGPNVSEITCHARVRVVYLLAAQ